MNSEATLLSLIHLNISDFTYPLGQHVKEIFLGGNSSLLYRFFPKMMLMTQMLCFPQSASGLLSFCPEILPYGYEINNMNKNEIAKSSQPE